LKDKPTWIIDPVDGTTNFVHGFPFFCVSIGLTCNKEPVVGVVYNITLEKLYYASKGNGSYLLLNPKTNKTPSNLLLAQTPNELSSKLCGADVKIPNALGQALIATEYGSSKDFVQLDAKVKIIQTIIKPPIAARGIRSVGSAALSMCLVAEGSVDLYYEAGVHAWVL
jgi:fructose-1,6-bisphosphatase/inositol monophosphatase family enzyme